MVNYKTAQVGDAMYVDNLRFLQEIDDLAVTAAWKNSSADSYAISVQSQVTNNSDEAIAIQIVKENPWDWPKFDATISGERTGYLTFDVKGIAAVGTLWVVALDANGNKIGSDLLATTPAANSWTNYHIDLYEKGFTAEQISQIASIQFAPGVNSAAAQAGDAMYIDNLQFLPNDNA
jgi:hypothetical protein